MELTEPMKRLLNRGLNFAILPLKIDLTQILVDFKRFERSTIWHEFWFGHETKPNDPPIFKTKKTNFPKKHTVPEGLKTFLHAVKSEIVDPRNRNKEKCNLPVEEIQALKQLIKLQRERVIIIKPCDKGAGIIILDFKEYMQSCYEQLNSRLNFENGESKSYYQKVEDWELLKAKKEIHKLLNEGLTRNILSKNEYDAMNPDDKNPGKYYQNFKIHKEHEPMKAPPPRAIISGSGSIGEFCGKYIEHHIKPISEKHKAFIEDTPDWLRVIETLNLGPELPFNSILVTWDVKALFTNILAKDGLESLKKALENRENQEIPSDFLLKMMEIILKHNIFSFNGELFRQEIGAAMGSPPIPAYANIFMAGNMDEQIRNLAGKYQDQNSQKLLVLKRFLDDYISIFRGSTKKLHDFFDELNTIYPTIKLTMSHTSIPNESYEDKCQCEDKQSIPFLDTQISIKNNRIETDLYRKETDRNQYLLPSSCHPVQTTRNVPFSLSLRIVRICSDKEKRENRFSELKTLLLSRRYKERTIDAAIDRARQIPRKVALRKVGKKQTSKRPVFALTYDPRLPSITNLQAKHWRAMVAMDPYLASVFPQPPLTGFRRQKNLRDHIIRAQVPIQPKRYPERRKMGMRKCGKQCTACPFVIEGKDIKIKDTKWEIRQDVDCNTYNVVYMIKCTKEGCKENIYIGETKRIMKFRIDEHKGYIVNKRIEQATGAHFNLPGHSINNLSVTILERSRSNDELYRKEREKRHIKLFKAYHEGMNRQE